MVKFRQFLTELSARDTSVFLFVCCCFFSFPDNNFDDINGLSPNLVCALIL